MNGHTNRGYSLSPLHIPGYVEPNRPPPTPREMYALGITDDQHGKQAPPPPKRNPETRLSSSSASGHQSEPVWLQYNTYQQQQQQQQQFHQHYERQQVTLNQSPRHNINGSPVSQTKFAYEPLSPTHMGNQAQRFLNNVSPVLRTKFTHEQQSPSPVANRPFSYGAPVGMVSQLNRTMNSENKNIHDFHQNGHQNGQGSQYDDQSGGYPALNYGRSESAYNPQPHKPSPSRTLPHPTGQDQSYQSQVQNYSQNPHIQSHSLGNDGANTTIIQGPVSPLYYPNLSLRSKSLPSEYFQNAVHPGSPVHPRLPSSQYMRDSYRTVAYPNRSSSPPLPPPPPELLEDYSAQHSLSYMPQSIPNAGFSVGANSLQNRHQPPGVATPPLPPVSSIPKWKPESENSVPKNLTVNQMGGISNVLTMGGNQNVQIPSQSATSGDDLLAATGLVQQISKVQLKKTEGEVTSRSRQTGIAELPGVKLRQTSARIKLLEKDGIRLAPDEQSVPDAETQTPRQSSDVPLNCQSSIAEQPTIVSPILDKLEKQTRNIDGKGDHYNRNQGDTSRNSSMDFNLDDIDLNEIPGYTPITKSTPIWKKDMIEKKNQEKIQEYILKKQKEKEEADKWKNVPAWKRKLMLEKEKEKEKMTEEDQKKAAEEEATRKRMLKQAEEERKAYIKEQQEMEKRMQEELQDVPEWKREIMMKRGGAIKNWKDEREDVNVKMSNN